MALDDKLQLEKTRLKYLREEFLKERERIQKYTPIQTQPGTEYSRHTHPYR